MTSKGTAGWNLRLDFSTATIVRSIGVVLAVAIATLSIYRGHICFRCDDVIVTDTKGESQRAPTYIGKNGRLFVRYINVCLVTDINREMIGGWQGLLYLRTPWFMLVSRTDPALIDLGKDEMGGFEFRSPMLAGGRINGRLKVRVK